MPTLEVHDAAQQVAQQLAQHGGLAEYLTAGGGVAAGALLTQVGNWLLAARKQQKDDAQAAQEAASRAKEADAEREKALNALNEFVNERIKMAMAHDANETTRLRAELRAVWVYVERLRQALIVAQIPVPQAPDFSVHPTEPHAHAHETEIFSETIITSK